MGREKTKKKLNANIFMILFDAQECSLSLFWIKESIRSCPQSSCSDIDLFLWPTGETG